MIVGLTASSSATAPIIGSPSPLAVATFQLDQYSTTTTEEDSDSDDGTVYADTKDELTDDKTATLRPDSSLSDVSNTHTDNTLKSVESIPDRANSELNNSTASGSSTTSNPLSPLNVGPITEPDISCSPDEQLTATTCPVIMRINSATSSESSDHEILNSLEENNKNNKRDTYSMANIMSAAAGQVEKAVSAAMSIIKQDRAECSTRTVTVEENAAVVVDCDTIEVDFTSDSEPSPVTLGYQPDTSHKSALDEEIDDSDEADALSASSLD